MKFRDEIALNELRGNLEPGTQRSRLNVEQLTARIKCSYRQTLRILDNLEKLGEIRRDRSRGPKYMEIHITPKQTEIASGSSTEH